MQSNLTSTWFKVAANKNHNFFVTGSACGKVKKTRQFDSQEYERNALPNLRCWLTTSSRVKMPLQPLTIFSCPWQMGQFACFSSKVLCVVSYISIGNHVCVKSLGVARGWQMPDPVAAQNLLPHSLTDKAGKWGAGHSCNWLMHYILSVRCIVSSPDETMRREWKIRCAAEYFWWTSRCFIWWWNTVSNAWYYFSNKWF